MESDNSDRSSRCVVAASGGKNPRAVCVAFGADRESYQASRPGNDRVAHPAGRPVEVSGVMVYVRDAGEGAQSVSAALTREG